MTGVRIDEDSVLSRLADWHAQKNQAPLTAMGDGHAQALFVTNEILIDGDDPALTEEIAGRYGGELLEDPPLPPHREGAEPRDVDMATAPKVVRLRFDRPPPISAEAWIEEALARNPSARHRRRRLRLRRPGRGCGRTARPGRARWRQRRGPVVGSDALVDDHRRRWWRPHDVALLRRPVTASSRRGSWSTRSAEWAGRSNRCSWASATAVSGSTRRASPMLGPGQKVSDFGPAVPQWNLLLDGWGVQGQPAYGTNPSKCSGGSTARTTGTRWPTRR